MSFWILLVRIAILILSFLAGAGAKSTYDYHYKKLPLVSRKCNCGSPLCKCNRNYLPLLRREHGDEYMSMTQAEVDEFYENYPQGVPVAPGAGGWMAPTDIQKRAAEIERANQQGSHTQRYPNDPSRIGSSQPIKARDPVTGELVIIGWNSWGSYLD